jgi:hypothetical protein
MESMPSPFGIVTSKVSSTSNNLRSINQQEVIVFGNTDVSIIMPDLTIGKVYYSNTMGQLVSGNFYGHVEQMSYIEDKANKTLVSLMSRIGMATSSTHLMIDLGK